MNFPDSEAYQFDMIGMVIGAESAAAFDEFTRTDLDDQMTKQNRYDWPNYFRTARTIPAEVMTPPVTVRPLMTPALVPIRFASSRTRVIRNML